MADCQIDVLMITYRSPEYVERTLPRLLSSATDRTRVWLWHNGDDAETLSVVRRYLKNPAVAAFYHSQKNMRLTAPTNWLWRNATGSLVGKVDDDCLVADGWLETISDAHAAEPRLGIIGSWRFYEEDNKLDLIQRKVRTFAGGHRVMCNPWVQGSGYLMKRRCAEMLGPLREGESFTRYALDVAANGFINGWYYPFLHEEHLDDPRSPLTGIRSDDDLLARMPLSARRDGISTLEEWTEEMRRSANVVQTDSGDVADHLSRLRRIRAKLRPYLARREGRVLRQQTLLRWV